jgi:hypothetical protein
MNGIEPTQISQQLLALTVSQIIGDLFYSTEYPFALSNDLYLMQLLKAEVRLGEQRDYTSRLDAFMRVWFDSRSSFWTGYRPWI